MPTPGFRMEWRAENLAGFSVAWNAVEGIVAVAAGVIAGSVALTIWGIDSVIEVFTAILVLVHLRAVLSGRDAARGDGGSRLRTTRSRPRRARRPR
jgi:hypothetical protein